MLSALFSHSAAGAADFSHLEHASVEFRDVQKHYGNHQVLKGVNLTITPGEVVAILGPSGSGKSTLIRLINQLETLSGGEILIDNKPTGRLAGTALRQLRSRVGFVFQQFNLYAHLTASQNITLALEHVHGWKAQPAQARALALLEKVGMLEKAHHFPAELSGGQQQRVAIARALASNPKVLLCDEATSALDPATTRSILELLKDINRRLGLTILLITHEMDVVKRICDCVAVISNGQLIEQDTVSEVFSHPKTPLAQQFIQSTLHLDIPDDYQARLKPTATADSVPMLRMEFTGHSVDAPLLSETARRFNVNNNIISAQMDYAGGVKFGIMLTEMHGTQEDTQAAIAWLQEHHVKVEVLGYV